jgi:transcription initiation factor TFIIF subunit alpha
MRYLRKLKRTKEKKPSRGRKPKREHVEELDFEEDFADDEEVDFGIEDKEEAKEASKRLYGEAANKSFFGSEDWDDFEEIDGSKGPTSTMEKALAKALRRFEKNEAYEDDDDENPYISDLVRRLFKAIMLIKNDG